MFFWPCIMNWLYNNYQLDALTIISWFQTFAVVWILYIFFWVFPRRQIVVGRLFGTPYQFHLQRLGVQYSTSTPSLWRWNWYRVPKRRPTTIWHRGNTQKIIYNIQITAKVWNQENLRRFVICYLINTPLLLSLWYQYSSPFRPQTFRFLSFNQKWENFISTGMYRENLIAMDCQTGNCADSSTEGERTLAVRARKA